MQDNDRIRGIETKALFLLKARWLGRQEVQRNQEMRCQENLTFEDYKTCLFNDSTEYRSQLMFRSAKHEVHTIGVNKVALN